MVIDGNDQRGIDVGLMTGKDHPIGMMRIHVDDRDHQGSGIFSHDCPEYAIALPCGATLWVLVHHLKSKGYGGKEAPDRKRKAQATRVKALYDSKVAATPAPTGCATPATRSTACCCHPGSTSASWPAA